MRSPAGDPWPTLDVFSAAPPPPPIEAPRYALAFALFAATFFFTTTLGALWAPGVEERLGRLALEAWWASPQLVAAIWSDRFLLTSGLAFSIPLLTILSCHEMGHYLACRRYNLPATLPYFLPLPVGLGTLGAFIKIKGFIRRKAELFDVGIAGPLAGFVVLIPFLLWGIAHSPLEVVEPLPEGAEVIALHLNGAMWLAIQGLHGSLPEGMTLRLHPTAAAAWVGLLATALNLLPLGQLDGGHILYAVVGRRQRRLAIPLWLALFGAGFFWKVWWVWCLFVLLMGLAHPPVLDEARPLDRRRLVLAVVALAVLLLSFTPVPVSIVQGGAPS